MNHTDQKGTAQTGTAQTGTAKGAMRALDDAGDTAREVMDGASAAVEAGVTGVKRKASEAGAALVDGATAAMDTVRDVAAEKAEAARETLSDVGDRLAKTLERAADDTDGEGLQRRVLKTVAQGLSDASDALRERSVSELADDVRSLARRHPGAFMAAAAVAGFAAARFIRSSALRRAEGREV